MTYTQEDFDNFKYALRQETAELMQWFKEEKFDTCDTPQIGLELEACLVNQNSEPEAKNKILLDKLKNPLFVPELSSHNIEFNAEPQALKENCFSNLDNHIRNSFDKAESTAKDLDLSIINIGSLPTLGTQNLSLKNISGHERYLDLNREIMGLRDFTPIEFNLEGKKDSLEVCHHNILIESAATSLQAHIKTSQKNAVRNYNNSLALAAVTVGIAANSPYLFGKDLWDETRIAIFEKGVDMPTYQKFDGTFEKRVSLGSGYIDTCLSEVYLENLNKFPVLLAAQEDIDLNTLPHVRKHNGSIWRWNRPIIGFEKSGRPHFRIEHRTMAAGPTIADMVANLAFFVGLVQYYSHSDALFLNLPFETTKQNFYEAAKHSLDSNIIWPDNNNSNNTNKKIKLQDLIQTELLDAACRGLQEIGIDNTDIEFYLKKIIGGRVRSSQTGAAWQRKFMQKSKNNLDFSGLVKQYHENSKEGKPVHEWQI